MVHEFQVAERFSYFGKLFNYLVLVGKVYDSLQVDSLLRHQGGARLGDPNSVRPLSVRDAFET